MMDLKKITSKSIYNPKYYMKINIKGSRSKKRSKILKQAAEHYGSLLLKNSIRKNISVDIDIKRKLEDNNEGMCYYEWYNNVKGTKHFRIEILHSKSLSKMLHKLAHEVIHLKQYTLKELDYSTTDRKITIWKGKLVNELEVDYWDQPWEIEAFDRESELFFCFCDDFKYNFD